MIVIYNNSAEGVLLKTAIQSLMGDIPIIAVGCGDPRALSIPTMKSMLPISSARRIDVVFIGLRLDMATEQWLTDQWQQVRSVTVLGKALYTPMSKRFTTLVHLTNVTGDKGYVAQLMSIFSDETEVRKELNRLNQITHHFVTKGNALCV